MSVGIAKSWWNDDWQHVEDTTEPPEPVEDGRTCGTCYHWKGCPCGCEWGLCDEDNDLTREDSQKCVYWEEA